ncbi:MAG: ArsR/SmtB family transcription factor [Desulfatibacillaceae bacterium]
MNPPPKPLHPERIRQARSQEPGPHELSRLAKTFSSLGDPTRLRLVLALANGEMCVRDLAVYLGVSESAVSHGLRRLKDLSLVRSRRAGQVLYYSLDDEHVAAILDVGLRHVRHQQPSGL